MRACVRLSVCMSVRVVACVHACVCLRFGLRIEGLRVEG